MKCPQLITFNTRQCVDECPYGHSIQWSRLVDYMGQVCFQTGHLWGMSGEMFAILTGVAFGGTLCIILIIIGLIYIRYRKRNIPQLPVYNEDTPEKRDYLKQLELFRPHAYTFLDMLNDTRRQIRELHLRGDHSGVAAYKPVVRDLAKLLLLLNQRSHTDVPNDWDRISAWAEKLLKRYKRMSDSNNQQVAQLISFLQAPNIIEPTSQFTTLSTFKPDQSDLEDVENFNNRRSDGGFEPINPEWEFPNYSLVSMGTWSRSKEFLSGTTGWFDDDFLQLGYRPQDEITTEL